MKIDSVWRCSSPPTTCQHPNSMYLIRDLFVIATQRVNLFIVRSIKGAKRQTK
jgi:hypothetical protein